jgi:hypothetical protein
VIYLQKVSPRQALVERQELCAPRNQRQWVLGGLFLVVILVRNVNLVRVSHARAAGLEQERVFIYQF